MCACDLRIFLLTEIGKMIEFWILWHIKRKVIYMSNNGVGLPCWKAGSSRSREEQDCCLVALIAVLLCMLAHGKDFRAGQLKKIKETLQINWRKILFHAILIVGVVLGVAYTGVPGSHSLCYIHERYLFLYQRNWCTCRNTDN